MSKRKFKTRLGKQPIRRSKRTSPPAGRQLAASRDDEKLLLSQVAKNPQRFSLRSLIARQLAPRQATRGNQYVQRLLKSAPAQAREELAAGKAGAGGVPVHPAPGMLSRQKSATKFVVEGEEAALGPGPEANALAAFEIAKLAATGKDVEHPDLTSTVAGATAGLGGSLAALFKGAWTLISSRLKSRGTKTKHLHKKLKKRDLGSALGDMARGVLSGVANAITLADKVMKAGAGVAANTVGSAFGVVLSLITTVRNARKGAKAGKRKRNVKKLLKGWKGSTPRNAGDYQYLFRKANLDRLELIAKWTMKKMRRKEGRMSLEAITSALGGVAGILAILATVGVAGAAIPVAGWVIAGVALALGLALAGWKLGSWAKKRAQSVKIWMDANGKTGKKAALKMFFSIKKGKELKLAAEKFNKDKALAAQLPGQTGKEKSSKRDAYARELVDFLNEEDPVVKLYAEDLVLALGLKPDDLRKGNKDGIGLLKDKMASA